MVGSLCIEEQKSEGDCEWAMEGGGPNRDKEICFVTSEVYCTQNYYYTENNQNVGKSIMFREVKLIYCISLKANMQNIVEFTGESQLVEIKILEWKY